MLSINGRSTAAYGYAKVIPPSDFAWEYLRRHEDYHRDFQTVSRVKEPDAAQLETFTQRWVCGFPCDPETAPDRQSLYLSRRRDHRQRRDRKA